MGFVVKSLNHEGTQRTHEGALRKEENNYKNIKGYEKGYRFIGCDGRS